MNYILLHILIAFLATIGYLIAEITSNKWLWLLSIYVGLINGIIMLIKVCEGV